MASKKQNQRFLKHIYKVQREKQARRELTKTFRYNIDRFDQFPDGSISQRGWYQGPIPDRATLMSVLNQFLDMAEVSGHDCLIITRQNFKTPKELEYERKAEAKKENVW